MSELIECKNCAKVVKIGEKAFIVETNFLPENDWENPMNHSFHYLCLECGK